MNDVLTAAHLPNSEEVLPNKKEKNDSLKDKIKKLSKNLLDDMQNSKQHSEAKKLAKGTNHIGDLNLVYGKYEPPFADMVARYAIKQILDHEIEYGHYEYLHDVLLSHKYLNEQEKHRVEKNIDKAALNYIKRHTIPLYLTTEKFNEEESVYDFQQLVKIIYTDYISEPVRERAEKLVLKRVKNKKEFSKFLLFVKNNENLSEDMRAIASESLDEHDRMGLGKYMKR